MKGVRDYSQMEEKKASGMVAQRQAREVALIDIAEELDTWLGGGSDVVAQRMARQLLRAISVYSREEQVLRTINRCGLDSPHAIRSLDEYRKERRFAAGNDEPSA